MRQLKQTEDFDKLLEAPLAIVFKHSTMCPISSRALDETEKFLRAHPGREVHKVHVIEDRPVSDYIEQKTGVRHQSPQVLVLNDGEVAWTDSHYGVTAEALAVAVGR